MALFQIHSMGVKDLNSCLSNKKWSLPVEIFIQWHEGQICDVIGNQVQPPSHTHISMNLASGEICKSIRWAILLQWSGNIIDWLTNVFSMVTVSNSLQCFRKPYSMQNSWTYVFIPVCYVHVLYIFTEKIHLFSVKQEDVFRRCVNILRSYKWNLTNNLTLIRR